MRTHRVTRLVRMFIVLLLATGVASSARAQMPDPPEQLGPWIDAGDPRAVPILLDRLRTAAARPKSEFMAVEELVEAIKAASLYRLEETGPIMAQVYFDYSKDKPHLVNMVAYAAARYRSDAAASLQRRLLADPRMTHYSYRVPLLMALADRGDRDAIKALHAWTVEILTQIETDGTASGDLGTTVPFVRSPRLLQLLRDTPAPTGRARKTYESLMERLTDNLHSPAELLEVIPHVPAGKKRRVHDALKVLGETGTLADAKQLETLPLGEKNVLAEDDGTLARRDDSIATIKRRHWAELSQKQPEKRPAPKNHDD